MKTAPASQRLTDNAARDQFPRFSPDGRWIAFSSNRDGNYDVFVVPAAGGKPRQLTFHTAHDNVVGWTHDGKKVVFSSTRGNGAFPSVATLWEVPVDGGIETPDLHGLGLFGQLLAGREQAGLHAPSRRLVAQALSRQLRGGSVGGGHRLQEIHASWAIPITRATISGPCTRGNEIYFVADMLPNEKGVKFGSPEVMKSVNNIWKISDKGGKPVQVTNHADGNLFFPSISADGKTIVYEDNFGIWKLDVASGKSTEIRIDIKTDVKENETELVTITNEAEGFQHLALEQARRGCGARRDLHDRHRPRRDAARHRHAVEGAGPALVAERQVDRVRFRPHRPRGSLHLRRARQDREEDQRRRFATRAASSGRRIRSRCCGPAPTTSCAGWMSIAAKTDDGGLERRPATSATPQFSPDGKWHFVTRSRTTCCGRTSHQGTGERPGAHDRSGATISVSAAAPSGRRTARSCCSSAARARSAWHRVDRGRDIAALQRGAASDGEGPDTDDIDTEAQAEAAEHDAAAGRGRARRGRGGPPCR